MQIEAQRQADERIRAAGGFSEFVQKAEAARKFSEATGQHIEPEHIERALFDSRAELLAQIASDDAAASPPAWWCYVLALEIAERNRWSNEDLRAAAEAQFMRTMEAHADTLPLLQYPSLEPWPKGQTLPPRWREGLFIRKADLRAWAGEHAPHWLDSALLAELKAAPASPAEQWKQASPERKRELAAAALKLHGKQQKAAAALGISRQRLANVLRKSDATVAPAFPESAWNPHKA